MNGMRYPTSGVTHILIVVPIINGTPINGKENTDLNKTNTTTPGPCDVMLQISANWMKNVCIKVTYPLFLFTTFHPTSNQ